MIQLERRKQLTLNFPKGPLQDGSRLNLLVILTCGFAIPYVRCVVVASKHNARVFSPLPFNDHGRHLTINRLIL